MNLITYEQAQNLHNDLLVKYSPKTVKHIKDLLKVCVDKAIQMSYTDRNPFTHVMLPKFDNARYFQMPEEKIKHFMRSVQAFPEDTNRRIFMFLLHGRRLNEVLSLEWKHVDMVQGIYEISAQINKARRNMQYEMPHFLYEELLKHRDESERHNGLVFPSYKTGRKIQDIRKAWRRLLKSAGMEHMRIHDVRHMIGYYSINYLGLSIEKVSHMLGHTDIKITQKYVNPRARSSKEVGEAIYASLA
jgi:integrase